jgi:protoporphyrinogen oxidase
MAKLIVIGAGAMGLAAAYHAIKAGHDVTVIEAAPEPGGMAAHSDLGGISIERFYHFVCKSDLPTFALLDELGIGGKLMWRPTSMGYFDGEKIFRWGDPLSLLRFPKISLVSRLRYGLFAFVSTRRDRWDAIETESAKSWITRWCGSEVYEKLWRPLFDLKFYEFADNISAAWIWTRIKRIGRSRRSLFQEELGYLEGGSQTLVDRLCEVIRQKGGIIEVDTPAQRVRCEGGRVAGVETAKGFLPADAVICTAPTPFISNLLPDLPPDLLRRYASINNIGVCCLIFRLRKSVSPHFWINIIEPHGVVPGIIEFSNLRPVEDTVVYVPYYMPVTNPKFSWSDQALLDEAFSVLQRLNSKIVRDDIIVGRVYRLRYAQPVCEPGFAAKLPSVQTPIKGLQIADTCFYYPEDRGISESARLGKEMAANV